MIGYPKNFNIFCCYMNLQKYNGINFNELYANVVGVVGGDLIIFKESYISSC